MKKLLLVCFMLVTHALLADSVAVSISSADNPQMGAGTVYINSVGAPTWDATNSKWKYAFTWGGSKGGLPNNCQHWNCDVNTGAGSETAGWGSDSTSGTAILWIPANTSWQLVATASDSNYTPIKVKYSTTVISPLAPKVVRKATIAIRNGNKVAGYFRLMQDGAELGRVYLRAGEAIVQQITTTSNSSISIQFQPEGAYSLDGSGHWQEGGTPGDGWTDEGSVAPLPYTDSNASKPSNIDTSNSPNTAALGTGADVSAGNPSGTQNDTLWRSTTADTSGLNVGTYKEGIGILNSALKSIDSHLQSGKTTVIGTGGVGGGGTTDMTATNAKLDTLHNDIAGGSDIAVAAPSPGTDVFAGTQSDVDALLAKMPTPPDVLPSSISPSGVLDITFPVYACGDVHLTCDATKYSTAVAIARNIELAMLALVFYFVSVRAIRSAFV